MARERPFHFAMNGGEVSPLSLGRVDRARMKLTAETMLNIFPRVIGPMQLRPGLAYLGNITGDAFTHQLPFIFAADDTAMIELYNLSMSVVIGGTPITRVAVASQVTNGNFSSATGWTLTTTGGGVATISGGVLTINTSVRGGTALAQRSVTVAGADQNKEHALRIIVQRGPVKFRCGSTSGGDEYIRETELNTGEFSLAFTPTGNFFVQFSAEAERNIIVDSILVEGAGIMSIATPWTTATLRQCRPDQSGDVIFVANSSRLYQTRRIERRHNARSWGVALHQNNDGPFIGKTSRVKLTPNVTSGVGTMAASAPFFKSTHVGGIFRLYHPNTRVVQSLSDDDRYTDTIRIVGSQSTERLASIAITGTWVGTLTRQVSYDEGESWVTNSTYTGNTSETFGSGDASQVVLLRVGFLPGEHTSGIANISLSREGGGGWGTVKVVSFSSATSVGIEVLSRLHRNAVPANDWEEGSFSDLNGWPSSLAFFDGRLWLGDREKVYGSVSDSFASLDLDTEGDSGPIIRSIATGPVNRALSMLGLARLAILTTGAESIGRSSSFDEPMTPTNFSIKDASTQGSADVASVKVDRSGIYIQRSGKRAYIIRYDVEAQDYTSMELSKYHPTILANNVVGIAVQRQPDSRFWFWMDDGTAAVLVYEPGEDVVAWCRVETDGEIEDIAVLPNAEADDVFMIIKRTIGGVDKRYRERLAYDTDAMGGVDNYIADSYVVADLVATATMPVAHLTGENVVVWSGGLPILNAVGEPQIFPVVAGAITLPAVTTGRVIAGLGYDGQWKSTKLAYATPDGSAISQKKQAIRVAPLLYSSHIRGALFGQTFDKMDGVPRSIKGVSKALNSMLDTYDYDQFALPGTWDNDARLCIKMRAPMPAIVLGTVIMVEAHANG
jgi:hypothetical protein